MAAKVTAPYGAWRSPITADLIVGGTVGLSSPYLDGADAFWLEGRATEGGRQVLVRRGAGGRALDVTPAPYNVRTRCHEYGGGAYLVHDGVAYFANFTDQRLYRQPLDGTPEAISRTLGMRYADGIADARRGRLILVREDHSQERREPLNTLVAMALDGGGEEVLVSGADFYSSPALSPDGGTLAWLAWQHPNMPWDGTELWTAPVEASGALGPATLVAGGEGESIFQPQWSPDGTLYFVSDRTGWWNLYRARDGRHEALCPMEAEFGEPQWVFGLSTYAFADQDRIICTYTRDGSSHLALLHLDSGRLQEIETPYSAFSNVRAQGETVIFVAGAPDRLPAVVTLDLASGEQTVLRRSGDLDLPDGIIARAQAISFPTEGGQTAYACYYAPQNPEYAGPEAERPPLLVRSHGGPTGATDDALRLGIQYFTSRGFAVLDVNYGGSTGYGRPYRERLNGQWGIVDVDDCVNGARYLTDQGLVDGKRLAIDGGSAGGYTTLCALTFRDLFAAGCSLFGVSDAEALAAETHKFESRYSDRLIGPYPAARETYIQRSPIHFVDRISCPLILLQGLEDKVVPPNQAEVMYEAVRAKGLPVALITFAGEGHGFRQAANIKRSLEAEFYFFARVFGFTPAEAIEPVKVENL